MVNQLTKRQDYLIQKKNETRSMRSKEDAHDYRYFPDPDLLPLKLSDDFINKIKKNIPELPDEKKKKIY